MAQTLSEIREMLDAAGLRPQKSFGQNFLIDHNLLAEIVAMADLSPGDAVLEIGPGTGALTDLLLEAGANVLAVEIDHGMADLLRNRYAGNEHFELLECDVLASKHQINSEVLQKARQHAASTHGKLKLVANLPYNIATSLVCELLILAEKEHRQSGSGLPLEAITATVQKEAAERLACGPQTHTQYGPAAILCNLLSHVRTGRILPPEAFWPRPKVTSQVIRFVAGANEIMRQHPTKALESLRELLAGCFSQRRKKISSAYSRCKDRFEKDLWLQALNSSQIDPNLRPENIAPENYAKLSAMLNL